MINYLNCMINTLNTFFLFQKTDLLTISIINRSENEIYNAFFKNETIIKFSPD